MGTLMVAEFEIIRGNINKPQQTELLIEKIKGYFKETQDHGTLYIGYPLIADTNSKITLDALLISISRGMIVFTFENSKQSIEDLKDNQDELYYQLDHYLKKYSSLRQGREVAISPVIITIVLDEKKELVSTEKYFFSRLDNISEQIKHIPLFNGKYYKVLCETLQKITNIRPQKRRNNVLRENSKGWIIKEVEKEIANLDAWQKKAAFESPNGPQRIRGLAGTGKTIVLALKAAYLHTQHPEWNILVTFYTQSLKQQYKELIEKFVNEFSNEQPDWEHLQILHAWGNQIEDGVYYNFAQHYTAPIHTLTSAIGKFGRKAPFKGICEELLEYIPSDSSYENFDVVLIDEAQDLPSAFFKIIFKFTKAPKRIIWAYDELQNLSDVEMPSVDEMFGVDDNGQPLINIENITDEPRRDIILPICYRNPPWILSLAHAFGFGIYNTRRQMPLQTFEKPAVWKDIGYSVISGQLDYGKNVLLERSEQATPEYFERLLSPNDSVILQAFKTKDEQYKSVAKQIHNNIHNEELDPDDILVIFPDAYTSRSEFSSFYKYLKSYGVIAFLEGINSNQDTFRMKGYVTCSSIYRAKGNEAPMVYVMNAEYCSTGLETVKQRNILFTAITRSRAWVRISGTGDDFEDIKSEFLRCFNKDFRLDFKCPTKSEMQEIRRLNRERTQEELDQATKAKNNIDSLIEILKKGNLDTELVPEIAKLKDILNREKL